MIAKITLCLIVITTNCQTAIQFARGDDCCDCCQNTVTSCNQLWRLSALIIHLSRRDYDSLFENLEEAQRGDKIKNANIQIQKSYSNIRTEYEYLLTSYYGRCTGPLYRDGETSQVLLAGVSGGFPVSPTYRLARLYE